MYSVTSVQNNPIDCMKIQSRNKNVFKVFIIAFLNLHIANFHSVSNFLNSIPLNDTVRFNIQRLII